MTRRPTQPPLTKSERAALDDLIRRGARALNSAERNRLLRLLQLDQADRQQERRTAGGLERANRLLKQQLKDTAVHLALLSGEQAEAELGALEAGIESDRVAAVCGSACSEGHTYYGQCALQTGDEFGDALRRVSDDVARRRADRTAVPAETPEQLHARFAHPGWEYATTEGPRKQWDDVDVPPDGDGWERNTAAGRDGWERWDYTEESYWRRPVTSEGPRS